MRRIFAILLTVAMVLSFTVTAIAASEVKTYTDKYGEWSYVENDDGTLTITKFTGDRKNIVVPESIDGKKVAAIGKGCFKGITTLYNVVLPYGLVEIGEEAFAGCEKLEKLTIPGTVKKIGDSAFADCKGLYAINLPDSVKEIGEDILKGSENVSVTANKGSYAAEYLVAHKDEIGSITIYDVQYNPGYTEPTVTSAQKPTAKPVIEGEKVTISFGKTINGKKEYTLTLIDKDPDWNINDNIAFNEDNNFWYFTNLDRYYVESVIKYDGQNETELVKDYEYVYDEYTGEYYYPRNTYLYPSTNMASSSKDDFSLTGWYGGVYNDDSEIGFDFDSNLNLDHYNVYDTTVTGESVNADNIAVSDINSYYRTYNADGEVLLYEVNEYGGIDCFYSNADTVGKRVNIDDGKIHGISSFTNYLGEAYPGEKFHFGKYIEYWNSEDNPPLSASIQYLYDKNGNLKAEYFYGDNQSFSAYYDVNGNISNASLSQDGYTAYFGNNGILRSVYAPSYYYDNDSINRTVNRSAYFDDDLNLNRYFISSSENEGPNQKDLQQQYNSTDIGFYSDGSIKSVNMTTKQKSGIDYHEQVQGVTLDQERNIVGTSEENVDWDYKSQIYFSSRANVSFGKDTSSQWENHYTQYINGEEYRTDEKVEVDTNYNKSFSFYENEIHAESIEYPEAVAWYYTTFINQNSNAYSMSNKSINMYDYGSHYTYTDLNTGNVRESDNISKYETINNHEYVGDTGMYNGWDWNWNYDRNSKDIVSNYQVTEYHYDSNSGEWTKTEAIINPKQIWNYETKCYEYNEDISNYDFKTSVPEILDSYYINSVYTYTYDESQASGSNNWRLDARTGGDSYYYENGQRIDRNGNTYDAVEKYNEQYDYYYTEYVPTENNPTLLDKFNALLEKAKEIITGKSSIETQDGVWTQNDAKQEMLDIEKEILGILETPIEENPELAEAVRQAEEIAQQAYDLVDQTKELVDTVGNGVEAAENLYNEALQNIPNGVEIDKAIELPVEELLQEAIAQDAQAQTPDAPAENVEASIEEAPAETVVANEEIFETAAETVTEEITEEAA